jgi:hypothetical protein
MRARPRQLEVPKASRRRFSAAFNRPASPFVCCNYRDASGRVGLARYSVNWRRSDDIHISYLFLRGLQRVAAVLPAFQHNDGNV